MPAKDVDSYLATLSLDKRATLEKVRRAIRAAAPEAEEDMSYGTPAFIEGKPLAGYAASTNHCAYYPMSGAIVAALKDDLLGYETSKGAIRFPIGRPLPATLIRKLVRARRAEIADEAPKVQKVQAKKARQATNQSKKTRAKRSLGASRTRTDDAVIAFLRELEHPQKEAIEAVRRAILAASPSIREGIKWNAPSFRTDKEYFATFNLRAKDTVQVVLHLGAKVRADQEAFEIVDPDGLLTWRAKDRALMTLGAGRAALSKRAALIEIVRAWISHV